jgi:hypothetical protein
VAGECPSLLITQTWEHIFNPRHAKFTLERSGQSHSHPPDVAIAISFTRKAESRRIKSTTQCRSCEESEERGMFYIKRYEPRNTGRSHSRLLDVVFDRKADARLLKPTT